jgi:glycosyltransferase involved in cell wall biosynthesis
MFIFKPLSTRFLFTKPGIAIVSVINDLATDHRVQKTCFVLKECEYDVVLHGRLLKNSLPIPPWPFKVKRARLLFTKGPLFYLFYNLRLFVFLLFHKADLLVANDLDTLPANYLASRLKKIPLIYDSHELFCDVPELLKNPFKRKIWQTMESYIVPKLKYCITVNESIAGLFTKKYGVPFVSVRNIPSAPVTLKQISKSDLGLPESKFILILQGAGLNMDRGAEELIQSMVFIDNACLLIIGSGDNWFAMQALSRALKLENKIRFIPKLPRAELLQYTVLADLGLSLDKNTNPNYYYSLPNKLFDYIHCGVPVLASRLPEIEHILTHYAVGTFIDSHQPEQIAYKIKSLLGSEELAAYKAGTFKAQKELKWETEKIKLKALIHGIHSAF